MNLYLFFAILESSENPIQVPASSKWPFDSPKGGHKKKPKERSLEESKRGHFEEAVLTVTIVIPHSPDI